MKNDRKLFPDNSLVTEQLDGGCRRADSEMGQSHDDSQEVELDSVTSLMMAWLMAIVGREMADSVWVQGGWCGQAGPMSDVAWPA